MLAAAGDDGIGITVTDGPEGLAKAVGRCCTGSDDVKAGTFGVVLDCDVAGGDIGNHGRNEKR